MILEIFKQYFDLLIIGIVFYAFTYAYFRYVLITARVCYLIHLIILILCLLLLYKGMSLGTVLIAFIACYVGMYFYLRHKKTILNKSHQLGVLLIPVVVNASVLSILYVYSYV